MKASRSAELYERAKGIIPGGVHSNTRYRVPHPLYYQTANGPCVYDVDGNPYIDLIMGNGAVLFGYRDEEFEARMQSYQTSGIVTGLETELSILSAERFLSLVPTAEQVRYTNSGTEAVMHALMMARSLTGKSDVAVVEGAYNGWYDAVYVSTWPDLNLAGDAECPKSLPGSEGLHPDMVHSTLVIPFNDLNATEKLIAANQNRLAAVIIEPVMIDVGYIPAQLSYLEGLREVCSRYGIVLIFDELLTGFRVSTGGAQGYYGIVPDLSIFGKALANGYMLAAVAGKQEVLATVTPGVGRCSYVGTYNGHQVSLAASLAFMELYQERQALRTLCERTQRIKYGMTRLSQVHGVPISPCGEGGHFHWYFADKAPSDYREAAGSDRVMYGRVYEGLANSGIYCSANYLGHHAISLAHDNAVIDDFLTRFEEALVHAKQ
jgi:glutamate-1-semialdehyde 2,1-aminomutase